MLFILFHIGGDRYAIPAREIVEVLPIVNFKAVPQAPPGIIGIFSYHGIPVPVVDLTLLATGMRAQQKMTTRIAIAKYTDSHAASTGGNLLGLLAEQLTETLDGSKLEFAPPGVSSHDAPYLGAVASDSRGVIQRLNILELFPPALRESLFVHSMEEVENYASSD